MSDHTFFVVDLETTGREPEAAHVVEWACIRVPPPGNSLAGATSYQELVRPPVPIPPETSAVHHIVDADVAGCRSWEESAETLRQFLGSAERPVLVAHNADFERHFLARLAPEAPWLCTYKAALRVWPGAPSHSNEALRYWLGLPELGREFFQQPHSAMHDAGVTARLLLMLLDRAADGAPLEQMLAWTTAPALLPRCPIGRYRNLPWAEVPADFLEWIVYKAVDMRPDIVFCAETELGRRGLWDEGDAP